MIDYLLDASDEAGRPLWPVAQDDYGAWLEARPPAVKAWLENTGFKPEKHKTALIPGDQGHLAGVVLGMGPRGNADYGDPWSFAGLTLDLPDGAYHIDAALDRRMAANAALGWALGGYRFDRYLNSDDGPRPSRLVVPDPADKADAGRAARATFLARDLINTSASDLGPAELAEAARDLAEIYGAEAVVTDGEALISGFPAIHAVGKGSARAPCLIDITWGDKAAPKVTLVGKGICFDSGGLDIKPSAGMRLMKKDMGGAAHVLGLAHMIMDARLPVRLRVIIAAAENSLSGRAYRPGDIIATRKGLTVEIGNTDAEGRLVLADALALADEENPELIIDFATLTGAARVALGPDLPALFTNDDGLAADLARLATGCADPVWRLPLWSPYAEDLKSKIADLNNISDGPFAGAVTAALFLERFVSEQTTWAHLDVYGWNAKARPGRPVGGEAMAMRAAYALIAERFAG